MSIFRIIRDILRRQFLAGVLVVVPLILTYVVLRFLFEALDGILSPLLLKLLGIHIPGLGILATLLLIFLVGIFTTNVIGSTLVKYWDKLLARTPIIRVFYLAAKQLIEAVTVPNIKAFKEVVMIEYPRKGIFVIGFATTRTRLITADKGEKRLIGVYIPSTPTPMTGAIVFLPEEEVVSLDMPVEDGIKLIVSGGIVAPHEISQVNKPALGGIGEVT
ncbi:MAG: DUF502 domain-containing protein [bacterium]|jgi:uncharacterized membrane protein